MLEQNKNENPQTEGWARHKERQICETKNFSRQVIAVLNLNNSRKTIKAFKFLAHCSAPFLFGGKMKQENRNLCKKNKFTFL